MYTKTILWKVLFWFCFFLPVKNIAWFNFQSMNEMIRKYSEGGLLLSCVSWKQPQAPVREFSQPLVATSCPLQLFFAPQPVLRPILGQLSNFVTVLIRSAITFFLRELMGSLFTCILVWSINSKTKQNSAGEADNTQMPTYKKNVHKLCSHWSSSTQSSCFLFTVRAAFSLTGINMSSLL